MFIQDFCWVAVTAKRMVHPNILPIEGAAPELSKFSMVSKWMVNGNIMEYLKSNQKTKYINWIPRLILLILLFITSNACFFTFILHMYYFSDLTEPCISHSGHHTMIPLSVIFNAFHSVIYLWLSKQFRHQFWQYLRSFKKIN